MLERLRTALGVMRSLRIYYGDRTRAAAMERLYACFLKPGDLAFDIGAHVGDRVRAFRRLGARVVAVEPQPALIATLKLLYGRDAMVSIEPVAVGRKSGSIEMMINVDNPTVSSASPHFVSAARGAAGWAGQAWTATLQVPMTTLDALVSQHGQPAFIKIDVEGFEAEVLAGLTRPPPALSFEFTTIQRDVALTCITRCVGLGLTCFNATLGENQVFLHDAWMGATDMAAWLLSLPHGVNSGDIYAVRA